MLCQWSAQLTQDCVRAYVHALYLSQLLGSRSTTDVTATEAESLSWMKQHFPTFLASVSPFLPGGLRS
jgi:hypothetical protein